MSTLGALRYISMFSKNTILKFPPYHFVRTWSSLLQPMMVISPSQSQHKFDRKLCRLIMNSRDLAQGPSAGGGKEGEVKIKTILQKSFPSASNLVVEDISGGCGSMYQVFIESKEFVGLSIVKQHQLVNKALKEEIKDMHGIRIQTQAPKL